MTPVVLKSAAGAAEEVSLFTVDSAEDFIEKSKRAGWKSYAAVAPPAHDRGSRRNGRFISMEAVERGNPLKDDPCILVLGNEGYGLSKQIRMAADYELSIPRFVRNSSIDSLNVSVAAGLLCHAFVRPPSNEIQSRESRVDVPSQNHTNDQETETQGTVEADEQEKMF